VQAATAAAAAVVVAAAAGVQAAVVVAAAAAAALVQAAAAVVVEREMGGPCPLPARAGAPCQRIELPSNHRSNCPPLWKIRVLFLWYSCKEDAPPRGVLF
jgi:hypothetical protein